MHISVHFSVKLIVDSNGTHLTSLYKFIKRALNYERHCLSEGGFSVQMGLSCTRRLSAQIYSNGKVRNTKN
eukprot:5696480-Amphidinium_carterae.1